MVAAFFIFICQLKIVLNCQRRYLYFHFAPQLCRIKIQNFVAKMLLFKAEVTRPHSFYEYSSLRYSE